VLPKFISFAEFSAVPSVLAAVPKVKHQFDQLLAPVFNMFSIFSLFASNASLQFRHISGKTSASLLFFWLRACYTPFSFTLHMEKKAENVCRENISAALTNFHSDCNTFLHMTRSLVCVRRQS